jgi:superfamily II DNA/RNA helicase
MNKDEAIKQAIVHAGIKQLNEMQNATLDQFQLVDNLLLLSNTGSGKTLAFLLSSINEILTAGRDTKVLVVAPSRELATQIERVYRSLRLNAKITSCYGGHKREIEENNLIDAPAIIVGTPGRLADHIRRRSIMTSTITTVIIDEYDKLLETNFLDEMNFILSELPNVNKRMLTSATKLVEMPLIFKYYEWHTVDFIEETKIEKLLVKSLRSQNKDKLDDLINLLSYHGAKPTIIFANHRESAERIAEHLSKCSIANVFYHGAMEQNERDVAITKFRNGTVHFLVTTDLASRGLDIADVKYIVHYHIPHNEETFTHRNGRTARMDASGTAVVIIGPDENIPPYVDIHHEINLPENLKLPEKPIWTTLYIAAGRKDKVNKIDIMGFLGNKGKLTREDIGLIDVKDFVSFVAVKKSMAGELLTMIQNEKIKGKKVKIGVDKPQKKSYLD